MAGCFRKKDVEESVRRSDFDTIHINICERIYEIYEKSKSLRIAYRLIKRVHWKNNGNDQLRFIREETKRQT